MEPARDKRLCAVHLFLIKDGKVLVEKRKNREYCDGQLDVIASHLEHGETVYDAVVRTAKKEVNIDVKKEDIKPIQIMHQNSEPNEYINYFFITTNYTGELRNNEPQFCEYIDWVDFKYPIDNMMDYINEAIRIYLDDPTIMITSYGFDTEKSL